MRNQTPLQANLQDVTLISGFKPDIFQVSKPRHDNQVHYFLAEVGTAPLFSSGATSAAVFLIAEAEAQLLFSANSEKRQRRYI